MTTREKQQKRKLLGQAAAVGTTVVLLLGGLAFQFMRVSQLRDQVAQINAKRDADVKKLEGQLTEKDQALALAAKQNYQEDLLALQDALKETNQKMANMIRDKATVENASYSMDSRLKNTTAELTRTLDDLKKTREALAGIDGQYKTKLAQATANLKAKEEQYAKLAQQLKEKEESVASVRNQGKDNSDLIRKYQNRISGLEANIDGLNKSSQEKDRELAQKQASIDQLRRDAAGKGAVRNAPDAGLSAKLAALERERSDLERQVGDANAKIFDQDQELKSLQSKLKTMGMSGTEKDDLLAKKEAELQALQQEMDALSQNMENLRAGTETAAASSAQVTADRVRLEKKIRQLEDDKAALQARLEAAEKRRGRAAAPAPVSNDIFADRNFRILTENLVKKEEEIKQLSAQVQSLTTQKNSWELGSGDSRQRLTELEILVNTLTKQLGEYAALLDQKDSELKASNRKINELTDEIEAEKVAAIAMQKELAAARVRQQKTFQTLTQIMGMNAGPGAAISPEQPGEPGNDVSAAPGADEAAPVASPGEAKKRAEELKKRVEVLLESRP